jgi:hypothetical protein
LTSLFLSPLRPVKPCLPLSPCLPFDTTLNFPFQVQTLLGPFLSLHRFAAGICPCLCLFSPSLLVIFVFSLPLSTLSSFLHPGVLPPLPAHLRSSSSPVGLCKFKKMDLPPTMLPRPQQAPAPWSPPSAACAPRIIELSRGVLEIRENRPPPDDAGPALPEPASAYPETRMLPRAAPRPRARDCTLESSLRCLRTSDHRVLRGVLKIRENRPSPDDAGPALQEPASAYPEARMLPRAAPRPRAGACTLESSLRCLRTSASTSLFKFIPRSVLFSPSIALPPASVFCLFSPSLLVVFVFSLPLSTFASLFLSPLRPVKPCRAAPRPRAGACNLESSLRSLRTSDHRVLRG